MPVYFFDAILVAIASTLLLLAFALGVASHAHLYQHFLGAVEARLYKRIVAQQSSDKNARAKVDEIKRKMAEQYGSDLSARHQQILDEEVEKVLSSTRR